MFIWEPGRWQPTDTLCSGRGQNQTWLSGFPSRRLQLYQESANITKDLLGIKVQLAKKVGVGVGGRDAPIVEPFKC